MQPFSNNSFGKSNSIPSLTGKNEHVEELKQKIGQDPTAFFQLAQLYKEGIGVPRDIEQATQYFMIAYERVANDVHPPSLLPALKRVAFDSAIHLSEFCAEKGEFDKSIEWLRKATFIDGLGTIASDGGQLDHHALMRHELDYNVFMIIEKACQFAKKFSGIGAGLFETDKPAIKYLLLARELTIPLIKSSSNSNQSYYSILPYILSQAEHTHSLFTDISYQLGDLYLSGGYFERNTFNAACCFDDAHAYGGDRTNAGERAKQLRQTGEIRIMDEWRNNPLLSETPKAVSQSSSSSSYPSNSNPKS